ncbi:MAG: YihY/virulence factor BrkB family protein, partial [Bdellovibrionales bacterium]|nr:YihY/virulence factor BrkB family protein [Bdellovibrionales bacterium]
DFLKLQRALEDRLWNVERKNLRFLSRQFLSIARVLQLALSRIEQHQLMLRASALTLFSLLALVPVLATLFGIAKGFGLAELVEKEIREAFATQEQVMNLLVEFSKRSLEQAQGGIIAGIGIAILLWTVVRMVGNVEAAFNAIWGIVKSRSLLRKFTDYLFLVVLLPVMLVISSSATVILTSGVREALLNVGLPPDTVALILVSAKLLPALLLGAGFAFLYAFLPNARVSPLAAAVGGLSTGVLFLLSQWLYLQLQFALSSYGAIYGSFAALPLFLIWLQAAWTLILFGAELSRAFELRDEYEFESKAQELSISALFESAARVAEALQTRLKNGEALPNSEELAKDVSLPKRIIRTTCQELTQAGVLTQTDEGLWVPIVSTDRLCGESVVEILKHAGESLP